MKEIYLVINKLWRISGVISLNKSTCLIIFLNPMPTNEQRKFEKYTLCHFLVDNLKLWWWRIMPINRHTYKYSICHKTDFCDWRKKPILYMNQELKEDLTIHYRTLGTNYSKNKIFRIHWKTYKANGGWKYMRSGNLPLVFLFSVLAEPWANLCAGKSSNEIRTCDRFGCGHYRASRYFYHMLSGLLTSWPPCLVCLPYVSSSAHDHFLWQQENSEMKPVTWLSLEQLPRTLLQVWALNWECGIRERGRGANSVFPWWRISPGFSKVKIKHHYSIL